jgi:hypothetical protein
MTRGKSESLLWPKQVAVSVAACFALHAAQLQANPTGPTVVHGGEEDKDEDKSKKEFGSCNG